MNPTSRPLNKSFPLGALIIPFFGTSRPDLSVIPVRAGAETGSIDWDRLRGRTLSSTVSPAREYVRLKLEPSLVNDRPCRLLTDPSLCILGGDILEPVSEGVREVLPDIDGLGILGCVSASVDGRARVIAGFLGFLVVAGGSGGGNAVPKTFR